MPAEVRSATRQKKRPLCDVNRTRAVDAESLMVWSSGLFDRDALRQVSRFIDVASAQDSRMVREKLQRNHGQQRLQRFGRIRHADDVLCELWNLRIAFGCNGNHMTTARANFFNVAGNLAVLRSLGGDEDDRHAF